MVAVRDDVPTIADGAGYFGVGILRPRRAVNIGTLWRSAHAFGAAFIFSIRDRLPPEARRNPIAADPALAQPSDTARTHDRLPYLTFESVAALRRAMPLCRIVGVEQVDDAEDLRGYQHPDRAVYLLGSEIDGLTPPALAACDDVIRVDTAGSLNVAVTGSLVLYDRQLKGDRR